MNGLVLVLASAVALVIVTEIIWFWLLRRRVRELARDYIPGWALPLIFPVLVVVTLRFGMGHQMVTPRYYAFGAGLGAAAGLLGWLAKRQRAKGFERRLDEFTDKNP